MPRQTEDEFRQSMHTHAVAFLRGEGHNRLADQYVRAAVAHDGADALPAVEVARALTEDELRRVVAGAN